MQDLPLVSDSMTVILVNASSSELMIRWKELGPPVPMDPVTVVGYPLKVLEVIFVGSIVYGEYSLIVLVITVLSSDIYVVSCRFKPVVVSTSAVVERKSTIHVDYYQNLQVRLTIGIR